MNTAAYDALAMQLRRLAASLLFVTLTSFAYTAPPYDQTQLTHLFGSPSIHFTGLQFLVAASACYALILAFYHLGFRPLGESQ